MKRALSIVLATGIILSLAVASAAPAPKEVIKDPAGDANALNDQGTGDGSTGDNVTPADASTVTDLLGVSFANDAKSLYISISTEAAPPATQGVGYRVRFNPGADGTHCLVVEAFYPGGGNDLTGAQGHLIDTCAGGDPVPITVLGYMLVIPRKANKAFAKGATLTGPQAQSFIYVGSSYPAGVAYPTMDTTKIGTDYKLVK
ncbi:MAG: hypothetical protein QOG04_220 [Actinomycetota bacterium]|nr:hypothetical protein [Actinomycetota bacterium]